MNAVRHLGCLQHDIRRRFAVLKMLVDDIGLPVDPAKDRLLSFVAIEALNAWTMFCRAYYLSCALSARRMNGSKISVGVAGIRTKNDALTFAVHHTNPKKRGTGPWSSWDEPVWRKPGVLIPLLGALRVTNLAQVHAAFGLASTVYSELPIIRNFFSHRSEATAVKVQQVARTVGVPSDLRASEVLCSVVGGRPQSIICDWLDDLRSVSDELCA